MGPFSFKALYSRIACQREDHIATIYIHFLNQVEIEEFLLPFFLYLF